MGEKVGEVEYDEQAELKLGASYPPNEATKTELLLIETRAARRVKRLKSLRRSSLKQERWPGRSAG